MKRSITQSRSTMHPLMRLALIVVLALAAASCGADVIVAQPGETLETDVALTAEPSVQEPSVQEPSVQEPPALGTLDDEIAMEDDPFAPGRLSLRATGSATGPTIIPVMRPEVGATWNGTFRMSVQLDLDLPDTPSNNQELPITEFGLVIEVTDVAADGSWTSESTFDSLTIIDEGDFDRTQIRLYESTLDDLIGLSYTTVVNEYGIVTDVEVDGVETIAPELMASVDFAQQAETLTITVPTQEVGIGATWTDTTEIEFNGLATEQTITYEVVAIDGNSFTVDYSYEQVFDSEIVESGTVVVFDGLVSGSGTTVVDITKPGPTSAMMNAAGTIEITAEGETGTMDMSIEALMSGS